MRQIKKQLTVSIFQILKDSYPLEMDNIDLSYTPNIALGDLALAFPFQLAKKMKRPPREIAVEIAAKLQSLEGIIKVDIAGAGYINLFIDRQNFFISKLKSLGHTTLESEEEKIIIEHTNINPNKAAHIGHLRNAVLGDTLGLCLKYKGENVEIQNYIDDTGVQVVDVVYGFMEMEKMSLAEIERIEGKFDYYCWDLYTRVSTFMNSNPDAAQIRSAILKNIEKGINPEAKIAEHLSLRILSTHIKTMKRLGISYDILPRESSILALKFWEIAFVLLKEKKAIEFIDSGVNKGCWVMKLESHEEKEKIIVRSDGTVTYVGKDIAYQLWKFGLLKNDFYYKPYAVENGHSLWITTSKPTSHSVHFGNGSHVYNVIDTRQSYLQKVVVQGLKSLKYFKEAEKSIHFSYEMVALSPNSVKELDLEITEEDKSKSFLEVSGRKGLGVKADDLLDRMEQKAQIEVNKRNPEISPEKRTEIAQNVACGALRYFMLKYAKNSLIVFDFEKALSFEGDTGPYLQYTIVRINSIFRKLKEKDEFEDRSITARISSQEFSLSHMKAPELSDFWELVFYAGKMDEEILHSIHSLEFSHLAKFAFNLCQKFNGYYHKYSILAEEDQSIKNIRILTVFFVRETLKCALDLMGIPTPQHM
ncbi:arginine--tRNA ligase [Acidobacteriota bacterium]